MVHLLLRLLILLLVVLLVCIIDLKEFFEVVDQQIHPVVVDLDSTFFNRDIGCLEVAMVIRDITSRSSSVRADIRQPSRLGRDASRFALLSFCKKTRPGSSEIGSCSL